jgi:hypothetical protein
MNPRQMAFPFSVRKTKRQSRSGRDLVGRSYREGHETVTIIGICAQDDARVLVKRQPRGSVTSLPSRLIRPIFAEEERRRQRAA